MKKRKMISFTIQNNKAVMLNKNARYIYHQKWSNNDKSNISQSFTKKRYHAEMLTCIHFVGRVLNIMKTD